VARTLFRGGRRPAARVAPRRNARSSKPGSRVYGSEGSVGSGERTSAQGLALAGTARDLGP